LFKEKLAKGVATDDDYTEDEINKNNTSSNQRKFFSADFYAKSTNEQYTIAIDDFGAIYKHNMLPWYDVSGIP
jgi:hypothetical protein